MIIITTAMMIIITTAMMIIITTAMMMMIIITVEASPATKKMILGSAGVMKEPHAPISRHCSERTRSLTEVGRIG